MAAKKFDLGAYSSDTSKTQAKHKKYSAFIENETEDAPAPEKAEEAKKAEAESVLKKLLAEGMSADEILAKLK